MKLLKDLVALLKASRIYVGYVQSDLAVGDFRAAVSSASSRVELEKVRTEYATVFGPDNMGSRAFSSYPVLVEIELLGLTWRLGRHDGLEEFAAIDASLGLWKTTEKTGGWIAEFRRASLPILRSFYRGHMGREDRLYLLEVSPMFSKFLYDNGKSDNDRINSLDIFKWLESQA